MHHHLEVIMPPTDDVEAALTQIMAPFNEQPDDPEDYSSHTFWDYWLIGGRWSGSKMIGCLGQSRIDEFYTAIKEANVTVSGLQWGKPTLQPTEQSEKINAMWNAMFPDAPVKECPLFDNYKGNFGDIMKLSECRRDLTCSHLIIAAPNYKGDAVEAKFMIEEDIWNGVNHVKTTWDGTIGTALDMAAKRLEGYKEEYRLSNTPQPGWLVVTVDYHS